MGKIIIPNAIVRKSGYGYYIDKEGSVVEMKRVDGNKFKKKKINKRKK